MQPDCVVVIPTFNEAENIAELLQRILRQPRFAVLVVDDSSPDGTAQVVREIAARDSRVKLLSRPVREGFGLACIAGFKRALDEGAAFIFQMDADLSHDPIYLPELLAAIESGCDVAFGSRYIEGGGTTDWGFLRRALSSFANLYARTILRLPVRDCTSGFRGYRRIVLETIELNTVFSNGYAFQVEMTFRALQQGYRIVEIPIIFPDRNVGQSKMRKRDVLEAVINVWRLRLSPGPKR
jgi:dolichol-phosphate mannosyltransferase